MFFVPCWTLWQLQTVYFAINKTNFWCKAKVLIHKYACHFKAININQFSKALFVST